MMNEALQWVLGICLAVFMFGVLGCVTALTIKEYKERDKP
jgi:hypothetical protein